MLHPVAEHIFTANSATSSTHFIRLSFVDTSEICYRHNQAYIFLERDNSVYTKNVRSHHSTVQYSTVTLGLYEAHEWAVRRQ